jgi:hypothetical protein
MWWQALGFLHVFQGAQFSGSAAGWAQENQVCEQQRFQDQSLAWDSGSEGQWLSCWLGSEEPSLQAAGVLGPDFLLELQGAQFSCSVAGSGELSL